MGYLKEILRNVLKNHLVEKLEEALKICTDKISKYQTFMETDDYKTKLTET